MTSTNIFFRRTVLLVLLCLFAAGCNNKISVTGQVTYSDTGEPVKFGVAIFTGETVTGRGTIKDGKYSVGLGRDGEGIPPGKYTVTSIQVPVPAMGGGAPGTSPAPTEGREVYYTKEPGSIEVRKTMTYDFKVERGERPR